MIRRTEDRKLSDWFVEAVKMYHIERPSLIYNGDKFGRYVHSLPQELMGNQKNVFQENFCELRGSSNESTNFLGL